jgi:hypothetical protein
MPNLTLGVLVKEARIFCEKESKLNHKELIGITDGKAVGTYVERRFQNFLKSKYDVMIGSSAKGIDLPDDNINTDIKVTSIKQPQSSCPYRNASQKIFGLGYNLLVFVYDKEDIPDKCSITFLYCVFIEKDRTGDYTTTKMLIDMMKSEASKEDIIGFLEDKNIPGDDITHNELAERILKENIKQGYLTISNALQWRLQYSRVVSLNNSVTGIKNYERN